MIVVISSVEKEEAQELFLGDDGDSNSAIFDDVSFVTHYVLVVVQIKVYHQNLMVPCLTLQIR